MSSTEFGRELLRVWGGHSRYPTYKATGWHAQVSKLTESQRGYDAMAQAGISVTPETLMKWLSMDQREDFAPAKANQSRIHQAYEIMAGRWDPAKEVSSYRIRGEVEIGGDSRIRGENGRAPLLVNTSNADWGAIADAWNAGPIDPDQAVELFQDHILAHDDALAGSSDPIEFPGSSYTIT